MGAEASAEAHPVVSGMNGATISILMRLKHAAMWSRPFWTTLAACTPCRTARKRDQAPRRMGRCRPSGPRSDSARPWRRSC
ncbi:unnamed protein product [Ectocarpus sp. 6 AP-2014]